MFRRVISIPLAVIVSALAIAEPGDAQVSTAAVAGCYRVEIGLWNGHLTPDFHPDLADLPREIELDTTKYIEQSDPLLSQGTFVARARTATVERPHPFGAWRYRPDGWIWIGPLFASAGFSMSVFRVGEELHGTVLAFTDVASAGIQTEVEAPLILRRIVCSDAIASPVAHSY